MSTPTPAPSDTLERLAGVIASRHPGAGGDPAASYVARLLQGGPDAILKKVGEEATEVVLAAKDLSAAAAGGAADAAERGHLIAEVADLWFHCMVMLAHYDLHPSDVLAELARREGIGGLEEKALRKLQAREQGER